MGEPPSQPSMGGDGDQRVLEPLQKRGPILSWLTQNPSVDMGINSNKTSPTKKLTSIYGKSESLLSKEKKKKQVHVI